MDKHEFKLYDLKRRTKGKTRKEIEKITDRAYIEVEYGQTTQGIKFTKIALILDEGIHLYKILFNGHYSEGYLSFDDYYEQFLWHGECYK